MHVLIAMAAVFGGLMLWYWRLKMAREAAGELADVANDVRLAARRFAYKRRQSSHPLDCVDDPRLAAAGIALAVAGIDQPLSRSELQAMHRGARELFTATEAEAADIVAFGRWIAGQANSPEEAVRRLTKVIRRTAGTGVGADLQRLVERVAGADGGSLGTREQEVIGRIGHELRPV